MTEEERREKIEEFKRKRLHEQLHACRYHRYSGAGSHCTLKKDTVSGYHEFWRSECHGRKGPFCIFPIMYIPITCSHDSLRSHLRSEPHDLRMYTYLESYCGQTKCPDCGAWVEVKRLEEAMVWVE